MRTLVLLLAACLALPAAAAAQSTVSGIVRDSSGAPIPGAAVIVRSPSGVERQTVTGPDGRFSIDRSSTGQATLVVLSVGFAERTETVRGGELEIVLQPARVLESVTVTPTRTEQRLGDVAASVSVIDRETIRSSAAVVADDVLRLVPTFSLFRRTSSLSAHPTAQGVSLRGIGPSGVSRSLVLIDGVPFNDPFGGWVYWTRVPIESVERIEVVDGTSSSVYGNYAMGGVINVVSTRPKPRTFEFRTQAGNRDTRKADFLASDVWGRLGVSLDGSFFATDGFPQVVANERGLVDTQAKVDYTNLALKADYGVNDRVNVFVRGGYFREERDNAKVTTLGPRRPEENNTRWKTVSGGVRATLPDASDLQARVFVDDASFFSNFMAVPAANPARSVGRMTLLQDVPTDGVGAIVQWSKTLSTRHLISAGTDFRHVDGVSNEQVLDAATGTNVITRRETGGTQMSSGTFVQGQYWPTEDVAVTLSGRVDHWRNYDARHLETSVATGLPGAGNRGALGDKESTVFSPRGAVLYHVSDRVTAWGSLGWGFRAPTLNELYRQFSVGALLTRANDQLGPERLVGGELGVNLAPIDALTIRSTWYDNRIKDPVSNVTIGTNLQQRQNLGRTRVRGFQTDVEYRLVGEWRATAGYLVNRARVTENPRDASLVGKFLAQVPKNRGSLGLAYTNPRLVMASVNAIFVGRQFDDDQNLRTLPGETEPGLPSYASIEFSALRAIGRHVEVFFNVQNLFDEEIYVQMLPTTIGSPRLVNAGVRVRFAGR